MLQFTLDRYEFTDEYTIGKLYANGIFVCYTLEGCDRYLEDGGMKVQNNTAIPRGLYSMTVNFSERFQKKMPLIMNVSGFIGIRLHSDSSVANTDGSVLIGMSKIMDKVLESIEAVTIVIELINKAIIDGQSITIEIK
jgi:hypothetical protein